MKEAQQGVPPPSRNGLSHAGKERKAVLAEKLCYLLLRYQAFPSG